MTAEEIADELAGIPESRMIAVCCPYGFSQDDPPMGPVPLDALHIFGYEPEDLPECRKLLDEGFVFVTCMGCSVEAQMHGWRVLNSPVPLPPHVIEHMERKQRLERLMEVWEPEGPPS